MEIIPLGLNGYYPSFGRQTTAFLVLTEEQAILLDAGTGVANLDRPELQSRLANYDHLDLVLSHYHLDHVVGLFYLSALWPGSTLTLHAPAPPLVEAEPEEALDRLLAPPLSPVPWRERSPGWDLHPLTSESLEIDHILVKLWPQQHPGGSIGLRLGNQLGYLTDRAMDLSQAHHVAGVDLLLHEVWCTDEEATEHPYRTTMHSRVSDVAAFAREAGVKALLPMHHHPSRSSEQVEAMNADLQRLSGIPVISATEGIPLVLSAE